jgi:tetratricopeptide (TPR) repeat protein
MVKTPLLLVLISLIIMGNSPFMNKGQLSSGKDASPRRYINRDIISCAPMPAYVPNDFLKKTVTIKQGIGSVDFPVNTTSAQAQLFFNQGVAFLYNFEYVQAARSFYTAIQFDSTAPMLYWGLSQAYDNMNDTVQNRDLAAKALALVKTGSAREKAFINLQNAVVQIPTDSASAAKLLAEGNALMDAGNQLLPNDAEMWAYTGRIRARTDFKGFEGESYAKKSRAAIDQYFKKALEIKPDHFGVWHFLVHAHEATSEFKLALEYGEKYTNAVPAIPHAWHMYAHDLMKTGRVDEAIEKFNYAFKLEEKKYAEEGMPAKYDWHHSHNMELLAYCYQYKGQFKQAEAIFSKLDTLTAFTPESESVIRKGHPYFYLQNDQPQKAIQLATPLIESKAAENHFMGYFIQGLANVFQKDIPAATKSYKACLFQIDSLKNDMIQKGMRAADAEEVFSFRYARAEIINMGAGLLQNPYDTTLVKKMGALQRTMLRQTGPDPWIDALYFLQMLTQLSINTGNLALAQSSATNMLKHDAGYPGTYWLLARIKKMQGDHAKAKEYLAKAKEGYKDADQEVLKGLKL